VGDREEHEEAAQQPALAATQRRQLLRQIRAKQPDRDARLCDRRRFLLHGDERL